MIAAVSPAKAALKRLTPQRKGIQLLHQIYRSDIHLIHGSPYPVLHSVPHTTKRRHRMFPHQLIHALAHTSAHRIRRSHEPSRAHNHQLHHTLHRVHHSVPVLLSSHQTSSLLCSLRSRSSLYSYYTLVLALCQLSRFEQMA